MAIIFCSAKLSKLLNIKERLNSGTNDKYGHWNAHLFYYSGKKCLIFVNKKTLYSFIKLNVKKEDFKDLRKIILPTFLTQLKADELFDSTKFDFWVDYFSNIELSKTDNDRGVIGSINDMVYQFTAALDIPTAIPFKTYSRDTVTTHLNDNVMGYLDYSTPREAFKAL